MLIFWRCAAILQRESDGAARCTTLAGGFTHRFAGSREADTVAAWLEKVESGMFANNDPATVGRPGEKGNSAGDDMGLERLEDHPLEASDQK